MKLSLREARQRVVAAQGLSGPPFPGASVPEVTAKEQALSTIEHLGYVQIDTISVVERAHHHVIWSRVPQYRPELLLELQRERKILEYWYHAASYLPMRDYRFCLPRMQLYRKGKQHFFAHDRKVRRFVLDRIRAEGPLQSKDFESTSRRREWFEWKPAKRALEHLFMAGELMVSERKGFQKVYDLAERVLPSSVDTTPPTQLELAKFLVRTSLRHRGLALEPETRYLRRGLQTVMKRAVAQLQEAGEIVAVRIQSLEDQTYYALTGFTEQPPASGIHVLSPFDPIVIQRKHTHRLFGFDYQIECYTPEPKRRYGYFCLPILWGDRFLGRLDTKADRKAKELRILSAHLEPELEASGGWAKPLREKLTEFASFNRCVSLESAKPDVFGGAHALRRDAPLVSASVAPAGRPVRTSRPPRARAPREDSSSGP